MSETTDKKQFLGMQGVNALLEGLKGEYSPLEHTHDTVTKAEEAIHSSTADEATHATEADYAANADHSTSADTAVFADTAIKAEQDGQGNVIAETYALKSEAVLTVEQSLTEDQKMQSRKNLGLYNKFFEPEVMLTADGYDVLEGSVPQDRGIEYNIVIHAKISDFYLNYKSEAYRGYDYGSDTGFWYIGNSELVLQKTGMSTLETVNTDIPFMIYEEVASGKQQIYIDESKLDETDKYGVYEIKVLHPTRTTEIVSPIPEEYIPYTIARASDVETAIYNLVNSAPETLDTIGELAAAFSENQEVVDTLNAAIANKVDKNVFDEHNHNEIYYTQTQIDDMVFITVNDIDEICGTIIEGSMSETDVDELMTKLEG